MNKSLVSKYTFYFSILSALFMPCHHWYAPSSSPTSFTFQDSKHLPKYSMNYWLDSHVAYFFVYLHMFYLLSWMVSFLREEIISWVWHRKMHIWCLVNTCLCHIPGQWKLIQIVAKINICLINCDYGFLWTLQIQILLFVSLKTHISVKYQIRFCYMTT